MKQQFLILFLIGICILLSGCWDKKELTDLSIVNAIGIDKTENGRYLLTFQIINPGNVAAEQSGGGGGSGGIPVTVYSTTGKNITDAARNASKEISRMVYYAHANLVVIGKELANEGIYPIFDALERDPQFRTTATIVISENYKAEDMLKMLTPIDKLPANKITKALKFTERQLGENIDVDVDTVIANLVSDGKEPIISTFTVKGDLNKGKGQENTQTTEAAARLQANGLALFKDGKLQGIEYGQTAKGIIWILDKIKKTSISINWKGKKNSINYQVVRSKTNVHSKFKKGRPIITVFVEAEGDIGEADIPINIKDPKKIHLLEKAIQKKIHHDISNTIKIVQSKKTDVFGFGDVIHQTFPKYWKKMNHNWNNNGFPELTVDVKVKVFIRRTGIRNDPYLSDIK